MAEEFTHLTENGVHMVEVGGKPDQKRRAIASGSIFLDKNTINLIQNEEIKQGNVLTTDQIAGFEAVKNTSSIIPLCHPLALTGIELDFEVKEDEIIATCAVNTLGKTGVEMEAITGVSVALLTVWDMVKAVEKDDDGQYPDTRISDIKVIKKDKISMPQTGAGLVRYFDEESLGPKLSPEHVIVATVIIAILCFVLRYSA